MRRLVELALLAAITCLGCGTSTDPTSPFTVWHLEQFRGQPLPAAITAGATTIYLLADTLDLSSTPHGQSGTANLVSVTRDETGRITRTELTVGYAIDAGRISINFHCAYNQPCITIFAPLTAALEASELLFSDVFEFDSRLYRRD